MSGAVLPREVAGAVVSGAMVRMGWAFGGLSLALGVPVLIEAYARADAPSSVAVPAVLLLVQLGLLVLVAVRTSTPLVLAYVVAATVATASFQSIVVGDLGTRQSELLLNAPALALLLVGVEASSIARGIAWITSGAILASGVWAVVLAAHRFAYQPQVSVIVLYLVDLTGYVVFAVAHRAQRRRIPNFDALEAETAALMTEEGLARRTTAMVHDTLLNDLSLVMNGPDRLDDRIRNRLRDDLATLQSAEWVRRPAVSKTLEADNSTRTELARLFDEMRWRGLDVNVSGVLLGSYRLADGVGDALVASVRAALENVVRHAGVSEVEVSSSADESWISTSIVDQGVGFDPDAIPADRLGMRESIHGRIEAVGGRVRVFSRPGAGTSIVIIVPIEAVLISEREARDDA